MIIGVTGSIGAGKSTVAAMIASKTKYKIADADKIAKRILRTSAKKSVIEEFGTINRKKLALIVFKDKRKLEKLNSILHPLVRKEIGKIAKNKNIIIDAPLLIERGAARVDFLIIVKCRKKEQIQRLLKKGYVKNEIILRLKRQMKFKDKIVFGKRLAKKMVIIDNSGALKNTELCAEKIADVIVRKAKNSDKAAQGGKT